MTTINWKNQERVKSIANPIIIMQEGEFRGMEVTKITTTSVLSDESDGTETTIEYIIGKHHFNNCFTDDDFIKEFDDKLKYEMETETNISNIKYNIDPEILEYINHNLGDIIFDLKKAMFIYKQKTGGNDYIYNNKEEPNYETIIQEYILKAYSGLVNLQKDFTIKKPLYKEELPF